MLIVLTFCGIKFLNYIVYTLDVVAVCMLNIGRVFHCELASFVYCLLKLHCIFTLGIQEKVSIFPIAFTCMYDDYIGPMDTLPTYTLERWGRVLSGIKWSTDSASVLTVSVQSECTEPKKMMFLVASMFSESSTKACSVHIVKYYPTSASLSHRSLTVVCWLTPDSSHTSLESYDTPPLSSGPDRRAAPPGHQKKGKINRSNLTH